VPSISASFARMTLPSISAEPRIEDADAATSSSQNFVGGYSQSVKILARRFIPFHRSLKIVPSSSHLVGKDENEELKLAHKNLGLRSSAAHPIKSFRISNNMSGTVSHHKRLRYEPNIFNRGPAEPTKATEISSSFFLTTCSLKMSMHKSRQDCAASHVRSWTSSGKTLAQHPASFS
jgi:hypothetical protein